jgi:RING-H2 zinc finger domain
VWVSIFVDWTACVAFIWSLVSSSVQSPYAIVMDSDQTRNQLLTRINLMPTPAADDTRLKDACRLCKIAMQSADARVTSCGHVFHTDCLRKWANVKQNCPTCQKVLFVCQETPVRNQRQQQQSK